MNGRPLEDCTYADALAILREAAASGQATLVITKDETAQKEFVELMEDELTTASESSSRCHTPAGDLVSRCYQTSDL